MNTLISNAFLIALLAISPSSLAKEKSGDNKENIKAQTTQKPAGFKKGKNKTKEGGGSEVQNGGHVIDCTENLERGFPGSTTYSFDYAVGDQSKRVHYSISSQNQIESGDLESSLFDIKTDKD